MKKIYLAGLVAISALNSLALPQASSWNHSIARKAAEILGNSSVQARLDQLQTESYLFNGIQHRGFICDGRDKFEIQLQQWSKSSQKFRNCSVTVFIGDCLMDPNNKGKEHEVELYREVDCAE